jgi:hypothetical protein
MRGQALIQFDDPARAYDDDEGDQCQCPETDDGKPDTEQLSQLHDSFY